MRGIGVRGATAWSSREFAMVSEIAKTDRTRIQAYAISKELVGRPNSNVLAENAFRSPNSATDREIARMEKTNRSIAIAWNTYSKDVLKTKIIWQILHNFFL